MMKKTYNIGCPWGSTFIHYLMEFTKEAGYHVKYMETDDDSSNMVFSKQPIPDGDFECVPLYEWTKRAPDDFVRQDSDIYWFNSDWKHFMQEVEAEYLALTGIIMTWKDGEPRPYEFNGEQRFSPTVDITLEVQDEEKSRETV